MRQVFILNAVEQAGLSKGLPWGFRLADGSEFTIQFERGVAGLNGAHTRSGGPAGHTPKKLKLDGTVSRQGGPGVPRPALEKAACPKCQQMFQKGTGLFQHVKLAHGGTATAVRKLLGLPTTGAARKALKRRRDAEYRRKRAAAGAGA